MQRNPKFERFCERARIAVIGNAADYDEALKMAEDALSSSGADKATIATVARLVAQELAQP